VVASLIVVTALFVVANHAAPSGASCAAPTTRADGTMPPPHDCDDTNGVAQSPGPAGFFVAMFALLTAAGALIVVSERRTRGD
jgi:hypothetical protein